MVTTPAGPGQGGQGEVRRVEDVGAPGEQVGGEGEAGAVPGHRHPPLREREAARAGAGPVLAEAGSRGGPAQSRVS